MKYHHGQCNFLQLGLIKCYSFESLERIFYIKHGGLPLYTCDNKDLQSLVSDSINFIFNRLDEELANPLSDINHLEPLQIGKSIILNILLVFYKLVVNVEDIGVDNTGTFKNFLCQVNSEALQAFKLLQNNIDCDKTRH